ncbi:MAG TPA: beta-ketoacyl-[acyl-carrier-protein] synthase family protein, partial [Methylomirabilota bacterium]|nr:beta-ketoacyl-[acyl-carrier-protein] synthase family protein [Methylomirabilota bacterium]
FDASNAPTRVAAEIKDFDAEVYMSPRQVKRRELSIQYGIGAARNAVDDSGLLIQKMNQDRIGIVEATSIGGMESTLKAHLKFLNQETHRMSPFTFINAYCGGGSGEIALELGIRGHAVTYCSGSCSGNDAMGYGLKMIQDDEVDVMLAGGAEAPLMQAFWHGFCVTKVMTQHNDDPQGCMRPYDRTRDGFLLGEGAAFVVLEELSHALARGARIYAEVLGHGRACEAYDSVAPHPEGLGLARAMEKALRAASLHPGEIDYINTHGTATPQNDLAETTAIKKLFGHHATRLAVSSTKPVTGHLLGAAGAIETVVCALAIKEKRIPPTINLTEPERGCDLDYVPRQARAFPLKAVMNVNTGFGGKNSSLILGAYSSP